MLNCSRMLSLINDHCCTHLPSFHCYQFYNWWISLLFWSHGQQALQACGKMFTKPLVIQNEHFGQQCAHHLCIFMFLPHSSAINFYPNLHPLCLVSACWTCLSELSEVVNVEGLEFCHSNLEQCVYLAFFFLCLLCPLTRFLSLVLNDTSWPCCSDTSIFVTIGTFHSCVGIIFDFFQFLFILSSLLIFQYDNTWVSNLPHLSFSHVSYL